MVGKAGAAPAIHERESDLQSDGFADSLLTHKTEIHVGSLELY